MAKSKNGGTRAKLRGRVGSDVYSIGKDGKGKVQQVVRGLAESVANPRSEAQMKQRMLMSGVSLLSKSFNQFIDHSFDGVANGQPSISYFSKLALAAFKEDSEKNSKLFGYTPYGLQVAPACKIQVSQGKVRTPIVFYNACGDQFTHAYQKVGVCGSYGVRAANDYDNCTYGEVLSNLFGGSFESYLTVFGLAVDSLENPSKSVMRYVRVHPNSNWDLDAEVDGGNDNEDFIYESNGNGEMELATGQFCSAKTGWFNFQIFVDVPDGYVGYCAAAILSVKRDGEWKHSTAYLSNENWQEGISTDRALSESTPYLIVPAAYAAALATYPTGSEKFLNGGDI